MGLVKLLGIVVESANGDEVVLSMRSVPIICRTPASCTRRALRVGGERGQHRRLPLVSTGNRAAAAGWPG